jgi:hypothetical protein
MSNYVAFECPEDVTKHPDVRVETFEQYGGTTISKAFINGCKTCQQVRSKCKCQSPVDSDVLLYDRCNGKLTDAYLMFFMPKDYAQMFPSSPTLVNKKAEETEAERTARVEQDKINAEAARIKREEYAAASRKHQLEYEAKCKQEAERAAKVSAEVAASLAVATAKRVEAEAARAAEGKRKADHEKKAFDIVANAVKLITGVDVSTNLSDLERSMLAFEKTALMLLPEEALALLAAQMPRIETVDSEGGGERKHVAYVGASKALKDATFNIYFTYPIEKLPDVATLFHKYNRELTVRPKQKPGEGTKAALGLGPDQGGVVAKLKFKPPADDTIANRFLRSHIAAFLGVRFGVDDVEVHNTNATMSVLLLFDYTQESPLGPCWESDEVKVEMYNSFGLGHLLA